MKEISDTRAQGDVLFRRVERIPPTATERPQHGPLIVAHSETGHHHVIRSGAATLFAMGSPHLLYLRIDAPFADVEHVRPFDTHETLRLRGSPGHPSFFEVRRQREYKPEKPRDSDNSPYDDWPSDEWWLVAD